MKGFRMNMKSEINAPVKYGSTPNSGGCSPHHLTVVTSFVAELKVIYTGAGELINFIEPRVNCLPPVWSNILGVVRLVEVLSHFKSLNAPTV